MKKIWSFIKKYLGFAASPLTLGIIFGLGVLISIGGFIFGFGELYETIATWFSAFAFFILAPLCIIAIIFAFFINPIKAFIEKIKAFIKKNKK